MSSLATRSDPIWPPSASRGRRPIALTRSTATRGTNGGVEQADRYVGGLFETFVRIEAHAVLSRPVPAAFGVDGYVCRYERHFVYWRRLVNGDIGIVTILHERMHQIERFREDFGR